MRPGVVWFGEMLPERMLDEAWRGCERCDVFLVVGTSGVVYPAAQLPVLAQRHGAPVIEINPEATPLSEQADIVLLGPSGAIAAACSAVDPGSHSEPARLSRAAAASQHSPPSSMVRLVARPSMSSVTGSGCVPDWRCTISSVRIFGDAPAAADR